MTAENRPDRQDVPIAVIGMGCLFPKASGLKEYWRLVSRGQDAIDDVPATHWSPADYFNEDPKHPDHVYCRRGGYLSPVSFDPTEFGIPPAALEATDTSQLLGLVAARMALEDAGYGSEREFDRERTSVILGVTGTQELVIPLGGRLGHPIWRQALLESGVSPEKTEEIVQKIADGYVPWQENSFPGLLGNVVAGRICNRLNLGGTNCVVDAACASSMSAMHMGIMELKAGRSDMVVTGGVDTLNDIFMHMCFSKTPILSPTGDVRPFSKHADGSILGEGVGLLVFKRLAHARRDKDRIYAVVRALGSSSDGRSSSIYAPRPEGQMKALRTAYAEADISPDTVELIEAHGTGTRVGDEVEFKALRQVFAAASPSDASRKNWCAIGTVKSMIGHTKAAAGAAGVIKTVLALYHKVLPPTLKADDPDPRLNIEESPFYLSTTSRPWISSDREPRRAGVSSFGFGGSNFHMVLEEYAAEPERRGAAWDGSVEIFALSGASREEIADRLSGFRGDVGTMADEDIAALAARTRAEFSAGSPHRLLLVIEKTLDRFENLAGVFTEAMDALKTNVRETIWNVQNVFYGGPAGDFGKLAFVFPGQGSQYVDMGRDLVCRFPEAMKVMEMANAAAEKVGWLGDWVYPRPGRNAAEREAQENRLRQTEVAQPAIGAVSLAMAHILQRFGIMPDSVCGHSFGELSALCAAGWIDAKTFLDLAFTRGKLMGEAGEEGAGAMTAVKAPLDEIDRLIGDQRLDVVLANRNTPEQGVISGAVAAIEKAEKTFRAMGFQTRRLPVSAAFHSPIMDAAQRPFAEAVGRIQMHPTDIQVFSNTTGDVYPMDSGQARSLLAAQMMSPVDFVREIKTLMDVGVKTFVEVGPKSIMSGLIRSILKGLHFHTVAVDASSGRRFGIADLARLLCHLAALGQPVALDEWEEKIPGKRKQRMSIPISGANYRSPAKKKRASITRPSDPSGASDSSDSSDTSGSFGLSGKPSRRLGIQKHTDLDDATTANTQQALPDQPPPAAAANQRTRPDTTSAGNHTTMNTKKEYQPPAAGNGKEGFLSDAFKAVQEGLRSMQALQMQTAETHKKFLETQSQANRTLQEMMESTHRLAETSFRHSEVEPKAADASLPRIGETAASSFQPTAPVAVVPQAFRQTPEMPAAAVVPPPAVTENASRTSSVHPTEKENFPAARSAPEKTPPASGGNGNGNGRIEAVMLGVVSDLTGYPEEMISLDMDIEADLGIDSIKRVEILSVFEEKMPGLPPVSPEVMGTLKTLSQIVHHIVSQTAGQAIGQTAGQTIGTSVVETGSMEDLAAALPPDDAAGASAASGEMPSIETTLVAVVGDLTGYPEEMIALDMDIEADLGIDSIKRVEILSAFEEKMPHLPPVSPEIMGTLKTLGQIAAHLNNAVGMRKTEQPVEDVGRDDPSVPDKVFVESTDKNVADYGDEKGWRDGVLAEKKNVVFGPSPFEAGIRVEIPEGRPVLITEDSAGLSRVISAELELRGYAAVSVPPAELLEWKDVYAAGGLVMLADAWVDKDTRFLQDSFALTRLLGPDLVASGQLGGAIFATISRMDGTFGFMGKGVQDPFEGGLAGLAKTAAVEWPEVCCHALDVAPGWHDTTEIAEAVVKELIHTGPVEVGFDRGKRWELSLESANYPEGLPRLHPGDVVVATGGAKGVTAEALCALAGRISLNLVLLGRSPVPAPEPEWLVPFTEPADMKRAILAHEWPDAKPSPAELEAAYRGYLAGRDITRTIGRLKAAGTIVRYESVDVRDKDRIRQIMDAVRSDIGPVKALIHGAGVLEDRLIVDKTPEQFARVFETKVGGLEVLLDVLADDPLSYLILFSSVAARMGNRGQADYAMANEVLNKIAQKQAMERPSCRVISFNWGPWDGGMVSPGLRREFARNDIELIPLEAGARSMVAEMAGSPGTPVEIVMGGGLTPLKPKDALEMGDEIEAGAGEKTTDAEKDRTPDVKGIPEASETAPLNPLSLLFKREVDIGRFPVVGSNLLDGRPVFPFALMTEWLGHGALHDNPGLYLHGLDDVRLVKRFQVGEERKLIRLMAGKARRNGTVYEVDVELRNGVPENQDEIVHSRARAILTDTPRHEPPFFSLPLDIRVKSYAKNMDEIYEKILFLGEELRGIQEIMSCSAKGIIAKIIAAPPPNRWMTEPFRSRWIGDPLVLDSAFQMVTVWSYEQKGMPSLPNYGAAYRQYRPAFPESGVTAVFEVKHADGKTITGDFTFLDAGNEVVAQLSGYEAVMADPSSGAS